MQGTRAHRRCERCDKTVHDLSAMTRVEARYFLLQHRGQRPCLRYRVGRDGTLRFRPPTPRVAGPVMLTVIGLMAACTGHLEAADMEIPDGPSCSDAAGYTIPCMEVDDTEVIDEPTVIEQPVIEVMVEDEEMIDGTDLDLETDLDGLDDLVTAEPAEEGCPLQQWGDGPYEGEVLMGELPDQLSVHASRRQERRIERDYRKAQRRQRRRNRLSRR